VERWWAEPDSDRRPSARQAILPVEALKIFDWAAFKDWVFKKYAKSYAPTIMIYTKK
jgi:hypothetical protein